MNLVLKLLKFLWSKTKCLCNSLWHFLCLEKMPTGITILLFVVTVYGTYSIAPSINQQFENQKIISSYITKNLNEFNRLSRELVSDTSILVSYLKNNEPEDMEIRNSIKSKITELQWRALELDIIFDDQKNLNLIKSYKEKLTSLRVAIENANNEEDITNIIIALPDFTNSSLEVVKALAEKSGLKITTKNVN